MEKLQKLLILIFALCVLVLPVNASAAYDPLYATGADTIFADGLWNGFEEVSVDGATYAYHVWYDDGAGVRADYYLALFPTYTTETLTYADGSDYQGWGSVTDGSSYNVNYEYYDFEYTDLWYQLYDDGSTYSFVFDYDGYYDNTNTPTGYDYYIDISLLDSGSYFYDYSYWSEDISWSYYLENNLSNASFYEYSSLNDPANGVQYWNSYWESAATGSYGAYSHTDTGTATKTDFGSWISWEWDWNTAESSYSTFSADYSSLSSSYERRTFSDEGDTRYYSSFWEVTDTPYYYESSSWENDIDGSYQYYYAGVLPEWFLI